MAASFIRISILTCVLYLVSSFSYTVSRPLSPDPAYRMVGSGHYLQAKNYYLLTLFQEIPALKEMLEKDVVLKKINTVKKDSLAGALKHCAGNGACFIDRMKFSEEEITAVSNRIRTLYKKGNPLDMVVKDHLVPSGFYIMFEAPQPEEMLVKAWEQDARGINFVIGVYAAGEKPHYPLIDSISFNVRNPNDKDAFHARYVSLLYNATNMVRVQEENNGLFFAPSLQFALRFLEMNERIQAADFEPMEAGENRDAFLQIKKTDWENYKYSVILVPGAGPEDPAVPLSAEGMIRCRLAAVQYHNGMAPFIMPSGGKVHPYKTKFCEATEMKKYLVEQLGVPAYAVIIEPHARHTTTNMRNAARLMFRYGMPVSKPGLTCTTRGQSVWIGTTLPERCQRELNLIPYKIGQRLSETELEFYPLPVALHLNPTEPMDP